MQWTRKMKQYPWINSLYFKVSFSIILHENNSIQQRPTTQTVLMATSKPMLSFATTAANQALKRDSVENINVVSAAESVLRAFVSIQIVEAVVMTPVQSSIPRI